MYKLIVEKIESRFDGVLKCRVVITAPAIDLCVQIFPVIRVAVILVPHFLDLANIVEGVISGG
jgi:hypothetical protein